MHQRGCSTQGQASGTGLEVEVIYVNTGIGVACVGLFRKPALADIHGVKQNTVIHAEPVIGTAGVHHVFGLSLQKAQRELCLLIPIGIELHPAHLQKHSQGVLPFLQR